ncbi:hypothetical protein HDZ31DRAFT_32146 [Schizophyllum fasciatum]
MSWAVSTPAHAPLPWADPALMAEYGKIPTLDGPVFQNGIPVAAAPSVPFPRPVGEQLAPPVGDRRRREDGWSGEWNMDMDDVRRRLRGLK